MPVSAKKKQQQQQRSRGKLSLLPWHWQKINKSISTTLSNFIKTKDSLPRQKPKSVFHELIDFNA